MNVVPDAGTVRRRIICAEDGDMSSMSRGRIQDEGDEMGLRIMAFADLVIEIGAGRVEIS